MKITLWENTQMERALKLVKDRWGHAFTMLGPELQQALVRAEVLSIIAAGATFTAQGNLAVKAMQWHPEGERWVRDLAAERAAKSNENVPDVDHG